MAIAKNPKRITTDKDKEAREIAFISNAGQQSTVTESEPEETRDANKKPTMIRIDPGILGRIDKAAKRLGISRSAFIVSSVAERLERME